MTIQCERCFHAMFVVEEEYNEELDTMKLRCVDCNLVFDWSKKKEQDGLMFHE